MSIFQQVRDYFLKAFNPSQPRDARGRWSPQGGVLQSKVLGATSTTRRHWAQRIGQSPRAYFDELLGGTGLRVALLRVGVGKGKVAKKGALKFMAQLATADGTHAGWLEREFYDDPLDGTPSVNHRYFALEKNLQGSGIGKQVLRNAVTQYERMGIARIHNMASLSAGGYTWARFGFLPITDADWALVKPKIRARTYAFPATERAAYKKLLDSTDRHALWAVADSTRGRQLLGKLAYWSTLELGNAAQMRRFRAYVRS